MSNPYLGEIRLFASSYAPRGWVFCTGQSMPISGNEALFSILGTVYGGDGRTTFGIPDLRGLLACGTGKSPASPNTYALGQTFGTAAVAVTDAQMPAHTHPIIASTQTATSTNPSNAVFALSATVPEYVNAGATGLVSRDLSATALGTVGGNGAHSNLMPTVAVNYIMCISGIFPNPQ